MAFEGLTEKLQNVFKKLRSKGALTEADVKEALKANTKQYGRFNEAKKYIDPRKE